MDKNRVVRQEQFNLGRYDEWKTGGSVSIKKIGQNKAYMIKDQWDAHSGNPIDPILVPMSIEELRDLQDENNKKIAELQQGNITLDAIIADVENCLNDVEPTK